MYGKVFESIYDGSLYGEWEAIVVFKAMIVLADQEGVVDMSAAALAGRTSYPVEIVNKGLEVLQRPDPDSRNNTDDGRRIILLDQRTFGWRIVNYMHYRNLASREEKREADRVRRAEIRNKNNEVAEGRERVPEVAEGRERAPEVAEGRERAPIVAKVAYTDTYTDIKEPPLPAVAPPFEITPDQNEASAESDEPQQVNNHSPPNNNLPVKKPTPAKRKTRLPADFALSDQMRANANEYWARMNRYDLDADVEFELFFAHYDDKPDERREDWAKTWRTWYQKAVKFNRRSDYGKHIRTNEPRSPVERLIAKRKERERLENGNVYEHETELPPH